MKSYKCWFSDETEADADIAEGCYNAEHAAETFVEDRCTGPDWCDFIDRKPVRVSVREEMSDKVTIYDVDITSSIDYNAYEVSL